ncbi:MAG: hypothetical protein AAB332_05390, partial [Planctomycetota bacterium]
DQKWYFAVVDVIEALTDSDKPRDYWYRLKRREKESSGIELSTFCRQLKIVFIDSVVRKFRITADMKIWLLWNT